MGDAWVRPKVLFFDFNETLLDLQPLKQAMAGLFGGDKTLVALWFERMLYYAIAETAAKRYHDFEALGVASARMVAADNGVDVTEADAKGAVGTIRRLKAYPDVAPGLKALREAGYRLVTFTNSSAAALSDQLDSSGLRELFDDLLSVEKAQAFKPSPRAYGWAAQDQAVEPQEAMLVAAHGWDVAGAMWAGWQAAFVARPGKSLFPLAESPTMQVGTIEDLAARLAG